MIINCVIVEDEPLAMSLLVSYVEKTPFLNLCGTYENAITASSELVSNPPDLIFVDIQMPDLNGLDFSKMFIGKSKIIFTTAFEQYALESYKVCALDYLLKPISYSDFLESANKALKTIEVERDKSIVNDSTKKSILIKSDYKIVQVQFDDILYIEGLKDYVKIVTSDETKPILSLMSMKMLEESLPKSQFVRVHRSFIVQPSKIKYIERNRIVFGKKYIPISDSYKDVFSEYMTKYAMLGYKQ